MKAEKTRDFLRYYHPYNNSVSNREKIIEDREKDGALEELAELERLATECQSPETQRLIEIGRATEWFYSQGFMITKHRLNTITALLTINDAIEWHRAQEVEHESD